MSQTNILAKAVSTLGLIVDDRRNQLLLGYNYTLSEQNRVIGMKADVVRFLYNIPSIGLWTLFNEGKGQFNSIEITNYIKTIDSTRLIDHASGYFDQGGGDVASKIIYSNNIKVKKDPYGRPIVLSKFGGYGLTVRDHAPPGLHVANKMFFDEMSYLEAYDKLMTSQVRPALKLLAAVVYEQFSDVENEVDGLITSDRETPKIKVGQIQSINNLLNDDFYQNIYGGHSHGDFSNFNEYWIL